MARGVGPWRSGLTGLAVESRPSELEQGLAPRQGDVVVEAIVDPDSEVVEDADGRSVRRADDGSNQPRGRERRQQFVKETPGGLGRELHHFHFLGSPASADDCLSCGAEVADPVHVVGSRLEKASLSEVQERHRDHPRLATSSSTNGQQRVRANGQGGNEESPQNRVEDTPDQPGQADESDREGGDDEDPKPLCDRHSVRLSPLGLGCVTMTSGRPQASRSPR